MMEKIRRIISSRLGASMAGAAGLLFLAMVTVSQAANEPPKTGTGEQKPTQSQQMCPAPGAKGKCQVQIECPALKTPGQTVCKATIDCPAAPKKKEK
jgi:hypothetical protein